MKRREGIRGGMEGKEGKGSEGRGYEGGEGKGLDTKGKK